MNKEKVKNFLNLDEKIELLNITINDLMDLRDYLIDLNGALIYDDKETIENIKNCINDFDLKGIIVKLLEIME